MKAWQVSAWGDADQMVLAETAVPEPGPGQVRIRIRNAGVNFFDILQIQGKYQVKPAFPFTPGAEVSGTIDAVESDAGAFAPGDEVLAFVQARGDEGGAGALVVLLKPSPVAPVRG